MDWPELGDIAGAETADRRLVDRRLAGGKQIDLLDPVRRELCFRVEAADGVERRAEEIEPQRLRDSRRPEIDDTAAERKVARLAHRAGTDITVAGEKGNECVAIRSEERRVGK